MLTKLFKAWNESYGNVLLVIGLLAWALASTAQYYNLFPLLEVRSASAPVRRMMTSRPPALKAKVAVSIKGFASNEGKCFLALYGSEDGFNEPASALKWEQLDVIDKQAHWEVDGLNDGQYAVMAFHDLNNNETLDISKPNVPTERYGFSKNARGKLGLPTFEEAAFKVEMPGVEIDIEIK